LATKRWEFAVDIIASDQQLVARMKAGDEAAYQTLLDRFERPLYRFFYYSVTREDLACDMCGETFSEFVAALNGDKLRDPGRLPGFIWGIARNVLLRHRRRSSRLTCTEISNDVTSGKPAVVREVAVREELNRVMRVIEGFKEPERQVMLLRFVEQLQLREITAALQIPINSVKSYVHRARRRLVDVLSNGQYDSEETRYEKR
jgi:RNA polymerase sigma-70 factor (ECF subfamily)